MDSLIFPPKQLPITSFPSKNICLMNKQIGKQFMFAHLRNSGTDCWGSEGMRRWHSFFFSFYLLTPFTHFSHALPQFYNCSLDSGWGRWFGLIGLQENGIPFGKSKLASYITHSEMTGIELPPPTTSPRVACSSEIGRELWCSEMEFRLR